MGYIFIKLLFTFKLNTLFSRLYKVTRRESKTYWILLSVYINTEAVFRNSPRQTFQDNGSSHTARRGMGETIQDRL